jgi:chitinase
VNGATVTATGSTGTFTATTNSAGDYTLSGLPSGTYSVSANKTGFSQSSVKTVTVGPSKTLINHTLGN